MSYLVGRLGNTMTQWEKVVFPLHSGWLMIPGSHWVVVLCRVFSLSVGPCPYHGVQLNVAGIQITWASPYA